MCGLVCGCAAGLSSVTPCVEFQVENGAVVCRGAGFEVPLIIRKGDGGFTYGSTDLAALSHRIKEDKVGSRFLFR